MKGDSARAAGKAAESHTAAAPLFAAPLAMWTAFRSAAFIEHVEDFFEKNASALELPKGALVSFGVTLPQHACFQAASGHNKSVGGTRVLGPFEGLLHDSITASFPKYLECTETGILRAGRQRRQPGAGNWGEQQIVPSVDSLLLILEAGCKDLGGPWPWADTPTNGFEFVGFRLPRHRDVSLPARSGGEGRALPTRDLSGTAGLPACIFFPWLEPREIEQPFRLYLGSETVSSVAGVEGWPERDIISWCPKEAGAYLLFVHSFSYHVEMQLVGGGRPKAVVFRCSRADNTIPIVRDAWGTEWEELKQGCGGANGDRKWGDFQAFDSTVCAAARAWHARMRAGEEVPRVIGPEWAEANLFQPPLQQHTEEKKRK